MSKEQAAMELRHAIQLFIQSNTDIMADESKMMEVASLFHTWEELLATKKEYPAGTVFKWGLNDDGETQLWSFISAYTPQEIYTPDVDISHYKKVGVTDGGYPVWTQPLGATDAYKIGDIVSHNGQLWKCTQGDGAGLNVWEPGVFGWEVYTDDTPTVDPEPDPEPTPEPEPSPTYPAWEDMAVGTALHVGDFFTYQGKTYEVLREMSVVPGWEPPALLNDFYKEVTA